MNMQRLEFGNPAHIAMVRQAEEKATRLETAMERDPVGTVSIEGCGECGASVYDFASNVEYDGKKYLMCTSCNSIIR